MAREGIKTFKVEGAQIIFRNFAGKEGQYNRAGDRNFAVVLTPDVAKKMLKDGWNVKELDAREEGDVPTPYITVAVNFNNYPPRVVMITGELNENRTPLDASTIEVLDYADILNVDLICNGYEWEVGPKKGTKAYLKSLFIIIDEDDLEKKYSKRPGGE